MDGTNIADAQANGTTSTSFNATSSRRTLLSSLVNMVNTKIAVSQAGLHE